MKVYRVDKGLYIRGRFKPDRVAELQELGVSVVVNLIRADDITVRSSGIQYYHVPLADGRVNVARTAQVVETVVAALAEGHSVLVHCNAGRNRSALVAALAMARIHGISGAEALRRVRAVRPNAVANPRFEEYLGGISHGTRVG